MPGAAAASGRPRLSLQPVSRRCRRSPSPAPWPRAVMSMSFRERWAFANCEHQTGSARAPPVWSESRRPPASFRPRPARDAAARVRRWCFAQQVRRGQRIRELCGTGKDLAQLVVHVALGGTGGSARPSLPVVVGQQRCPFPRRGGTACPSLARGGVRPRMFRISRSTYRSFRERRPAAGTAAASRTGASARPRTSRRSPRPDASGHRSGHTWRIMMCRTKSAAQGVGPERRRGTAW